MKFSEFVPTTIGLVSAVLLLPSVSVAMDRSAAEAVVTTYADIALAGYTDSLLTAEGLDQAIKALVETPSQEALVAARMAWIAARAPYQQTEVYRFGNAIVDDWEGKVNAWPLDEGLIDYVDASYGGSSEQNTLYSANIIANAKLTIGGNELDTAVITPELLGQHLHEAGGIESNVATGYHAIEFLLWGQDLNGDKAGAGNRPYTDYSIDACTGGHCDRRAAYLRAASQLLLTDLREMAENWSVGGAARNALDEAGPEGALMAILTGMGSLSYGELAGERMQLGLMLHDPEEEHDCFSDNTSASHYYDGIGIRNVFKGSRQNKFAFSSVQAPAQQGARSANSRSI